MSMPVAERTTLDAILSHFCRKRCPEHLHDRVQLTFRIESSMVTIFERRPFYRDKSQWIESDVARFRYFKNRDVWELFWRDSHGKWHGYDRCPASRSIEPLLTEVDEDPSGIFWG